MKGVKVILENNGKFKTSIYLHPRTDENIERVYIEKGFKSKSELMEAAIQFYLGYLATEDTTNYLPEVMDISLKSVVKNLEDRTCNVMFKVAVELALLLHVYTARNGVSEEEIDLLREACVKEVRSLNDIVTFKRAVYVQNLNKK